jgi:hypothetical protein
MIRGDPQRALHKPMLHRCFANDLRQATLHSHHLTIHLVKHPGALPGRGGHFRWMLPSNPHGVAVAVEEKPDAQPDEFNATR